MTHYGTLPDVVFGPMLVLVGLGILLIAWHFGNNVRDMWATTQSDVGTLPADGLVEVSGRVHDVPDPLTRRP